MMFQPVQGRSYQKIEFCGFLPHDERSRTNRVTDKRVLVVVPVLVSIVLIICINQHRDSFADDFSRCYIL